jgi:hypothetical protein
VGQNFRNSHQLVQLFQFRVTPTRASFQPASTSSLFSWYLRDSEKLSDVFMSFGRTFHTRSRQSALVPTFGPLESRSVGEAANVHRRNRSFVDPASAKCKPRMVSQMRARSGDDCAHIAVTSAPRYHKGKPAERHSRRPTYSESEDLPDDFEQ